MSHLEVHAHVKIRPGQLEGFKATAAEMLQVTKEKDTHTLRCDFFINEDGTECEVHEAYDNEAGLIEHNMNIADLRAKLFTDFVYDHQVAAFGEVSQQLVDTVAAHGGAIGRYTFLQGLQPEPAI